jgi:serine/threonine protein phosphatase PrpC
MSDTPTACPSCGEMIENSHSFCEGCGASLEPSAGASPTSSASPDHSSSANPSISGTLLPVEVKEYLPGEAASGVVRSPVVATSTTESSPRDSSGGTASYSSSATSPPSAATQASGAMPCVSCGKGPIADGYCDVCGSRQPDPRDHFQETPASWVAGVCDKGIVHARNEDAMSTAVYAADSANPVGILVVCDGVTTAPLSERASLAAARAAKDVLLACADTDMVSPNSWPEAIKRSCVAAQAQALAVAESLGQPLNPPSCTFVVAVTTPTTVYCGWCGDSRAYWLPDSGPAQIISVDDSIASQMIASGRPRAEAEADHRAHTITRWLGADSPDPTALTSVIPIEGSGWVAVVSDGMWNYVSAASEVKTLLDGYVAEDPAPLAIAKKMVAFANAQGGSDNITVTLARMTPSVPTTPTAPISSPAPTSTTVPSSTPQT